MVKPCPGCDRYSTLNLSQAFVAKPPGTYSIAGAQDKILARVRYKLSCSACGWSILGDIEGEHFVADPGQQ